MTDLRAPHRQPNGNSAVPRWLRALLAVPLLGKLVGANAIIAITAVAVALISAPEGSRRELASVAVVAIAASVLINLALVAIALRPIHALEDTTARLSRGDLAARVPESPLADRDTRRVADMLNRLLDALVSDRARMRQLAAQVIRAGDEERSRIARELHDSTAQQLAALVYQVSAVTRDTSDPALTERLETIRTIAGSVMEEVRTLAHTVHPRVLEDLGLPSALQQLVRQMQGAPGVTIDLTIGTQTDGLPKEIASVLFRVAQEALRNALRHGQPSSIHVSLTAHDRAVRLEVRDNGAGFAVADAESAGLGLFSMRERVALAGGSVEIRSAPGQGTLVTVTIPVDQ